MKRVDWGKIKKLLKHEKAKPIAFFAFYFIFFLFLAIIFRLDPKTPPSTTKSKPKNYYNLGKIEDANYHFKYDYNINGIAISFEGDKNGVRERFTKTQDNTITNYYAFKNLFMKEENNIWKKEANPYLYYNLLQVDKIREILDSATFISKTEYQDERKSYNYQISTTTLEKITNNNIIDIADIPNEITITMDDDYYVENIKYSINSYAKFLDPNINNASLAMDYSDFGNIKEIEEPENID